MTYPNGVTAQYTYYADNRLHTLANMKGSTYLSTFNYAYDASGNMTSKLELGGTTSYVYDALSRLTIATEPDGTVTQYEYDAFGNIKEANPNDTNPFRWCGEYFDVETKTVYLRARYYSPELGRFTQEDTYRGRISDPLSLNLYTYCNNNPVIYHDPTGHFLALVAAVAAAAAAVAAVAAVASAVSSSSSSPSTNNPPSTAKAPTGSTGGGTLVQVWTHDGFEMGILNNGYTTMLGGGRPKVGWIVLAPNGKYYEMKDSGRGEEVPYLPKDSINLGDNAIDPGYVPLVYTGEKPKIEMNDGIVCVTPQGGFAGSITVEGRTFVCVEDIVASENYMTAEVDHHTGCLTVKFMGATLSFYGTGGQEWFDARYGISYITYGGRTYVDLQQFNALLYDGQKTQAPNLKYSTYNGKTYVYPVQNTGDEKFYDNGIEDPGRGTNIHDINLAMGTPLYAVANGTIEYYIRTQVIGGETYYVSYGFYAVLKVDDLEFWYAHLYSAPDIDYTGDTYESWTGRNSMPTTYQVGSVQVKAGDIIGYSGQTGNANSSHLHFEINYAGSYKSRIIEIGDIFPDIVR